MNARKKILIFLVIFITTSILSCKSEREKLLVGHWAVDKVLYKDQDIVNSFLANMMTFDRKNVCILPIFDDTIEEKGLWHLNNKVSSLAILIPEGGTNFLEGTYQITFFKDSTRKLLKLELKSDTISIFCSKLLYDFDRNITY